MCIRDRSDAEQIADAETEQTSEVSTSDEEYLSLIHISIFEGWCDFLNYFDSSIHFQLSFLNLAASEETFANSISIDVYKRQIMHWKQPTRWN